MELWESVLSLFQEYPLILFGVLASLVILISLYQTVHGMVSVWAVKNWRKLPSSVRYSVGFFTPEIERLAFAVWTEIYNDIHEEVLKTVSEDDDKMLERIDAVVRNSIDAISKENKTPE